MWLAASLIPSSNASISLMSARTVWNWLSVETRSIVATSGAGGSGSAATAAVISSTRPSTLPTHSPDTASRVSRNGANSSSIAWARSAISRCLTTLAAPLRVCVRRIRPRDQLRRAGAALEIERALAELLDELPGLRPGNNDRGLVPRIRPPPVAGPNGSAPRRGSPAAMPSGASVPSWPRSPWWPARWRRWRH